MSQFVEEALRGVDEFVKIEVQHGMGVASEEILLAVPEKPLVVGEQLVRVGITHAAMKSGNAFFQIAAAMDNTDVVGNV